VAKIEIFQEYTPPHSSFDQKTILSKLKTKEGDPFSQTTFDSDLKTLAEEYDRIEPSIEIHNGEVYITIKIWLRPSIRTITWEGNSHFKTKKLQKELGIKPNAIFNRQTFNKAFNKVKEFYVKKGYFESQLQYVVTPDPKTNEVDILIIVHEGRSGYIDEITFNGFTKEEKSELLAMIYTKRYHFFTSWFTGSGVYNEDAIDQDKLTIVNFLQNKGYADAKVDIKILEAKKQGKIAVEINAEKGQIYHFGQVSFEGNTLFSDKEIESRFLIHPGEIYSPDKMRETAQAIKDLYGRKGYIEANVQYEPQLIHDEPLYNVHFRIEEGEEYKIGLIHVFGNSQTQTRVILRESLLVPGETFDSAKLKATQMRLENIGYFKSVNVYAVRTQDDQILGDNYRDVFIEVQETHTGNLSLFSGYSTADSVFGGLDLAETNFNFRGLSQVFSKGIKAIRGGGEYAHARFSIGQKQHSYSLSWLDPYLRDTYWRLGFDINHTVSTLQSNDYEIRTTGGSVYASYPLNPLWTFGTKYRVRNSSYTIEDHDLTRQEARELGHRGMISGLGASIGFDSTDSALKPHRGFRSFLETEFVGLGGNASFLRLGYINAYYTPLWKHGIMKYRFEFRFIEPMWKTPSPESIPVSERFFLGGENSVRGYRAFDLGPHFGDGAPKGGISSSLFSVEYLHEIFSFLDGFVFVDAGSVSLKRFNLGNYKLSYGVGARIEVLNRIPVVIGVGFPVNPSGRSQVQRFFFSMGGQF
jgi:outer membrane protein insertion porin family